MKSILLFALISFNTLYLFSQDSTFFKSKNLPLSKNELGVGYGIFNFQTLYFGLITNSDREQNKSGIKHPGTFNFYYRRSINDKVMIGGNLGYDHFAFVLKDQNEELFNFKGNSFALLFSAKYSYLNRKHISLYCTGGFGVLINSRNAHINITKGIFGDISVSSRDRETVFYPVFSGTPFGIQINNKIIEPYFEIGIGTVISWFPLFGFSSEGLVQFGLKKSF